MGRQPCCDKVGLKRGPWTIEEDYKLIDFIFNNGIHCWRMVPKLSGLLRCGKSCRLRWINYLRPDLKRGSFTQSEEDQIIQLHSSLCNRWSKIASYFPGRTDNEIKNYWNTRIKKKLKLLGLDPVTHKPIEPKENFIEEKRNISSLKLNKLEEQLQNSLEGAKNMQNFDLAKKEYSSESVYDVTLNETNILNNYENFNSSLDFETWMNKEGNKRTSSVSLREDSYNPSTCDSHSVQKNSLGLRMDGAVGSLLSWDAFNNFEQDLFFFGN